MLALVAAETDRIDSRFLEPACGSGNFLVPILERKLAAVQARYGRSDFERRHYALLALMCVYGIELLPDNILECQANLLAVYAKFLRLTDGDVWWRAGEQVLLLNVLQGDALEMTSLSGETLVFPEWGYLGRGKYQRRDFRYEHLAKRAAFGSDVGSDHEHEIFTPTRSYAPTTVHDIARTDA